MDSNGNLILKARVSYNKTFKIELKVMEHRCIATTGSREEWIWHCMSGHLNFRDINDMQKSNMVIGLSLINMATEVCEENVQAKQMDSIEGNMYFVTFIYNFSKKL